MSVMWTEQRIKIYVFVTVIKIHIMFTYIIIITTEPSTVTYDICSFCFFKINNKQNSSVPNTN